MLLNEKQAFSAVSEKAYAKLNISLDVTAKRDDGYHEMLMIMQTSHPSRAASFTQRAACPMCRVIGAISPSAPR